MHIYAEIWSWLIMLIGPGINISFQTVTVPYSTKVKDGQTYLEYHEEDVQDSVYEAIVQQCYKMFKVGSDTNINLDRMCIFQFATFYSYICMDTLIIITIKLCVMRSICEQNMGLLTQTETSLSKALFDNIYIFAHFGKKNHGYAFNFSD